MYVHIWDFWCGSRHLGDLYPAYNRLLTPFTAHPWPMT